MTHTEPMPETSGEFTTSKLSKRPCPQCGGPVHVELWESSCGGYEDEKYTCTTCHHTWWVDGPDA